MFSLSRLLRCTAVTSASAAEPLITTFVTDLEGDGIYFDKYVANSKVLYRDPMTRELSMREGCRFVYGGDLYDKGTHDMRLCKEMLGLKAKYPDRVTFIIGNRDLQKHKFISLLDPKWCDGRPIEAHGSPYYMGHPTTPYKEFLAKRGGLAHSHYNYLNWLVHCCYGAAHSLTRLRQEVVEESVLAQCKADGARKSYAELRGEFMEMVKAATPIGAAGSSSSSSATDEPSFEAIRTFLRSKVSEEEILALCCSLANPNDTTGANIVAQYADAAQLAAIHDGVLYVHGAVKSNIIGYVPSLALEERFYERDEELPGTTVDDVDAWVDGMNAFYKNALAEWRANPRMTGALDEAALKDGRYPKRGGSALFAYGHSRSCKGKSCIINSFFMDAKPPIAAKSASGYADLGYVDMKTVTYLGMGGVSAVMTGHQPVSDVPLVITQPGLRVVCGDTSYCGKNGTRGDSVTEVLHSGEDGIIRIHGKFADGTPYDFTSEEDGPRIVGRQLKDGWWVRAEMPDGTFAVRRTDDRFFTHETKYLTLEQLTAEVTSSTAEGNLYERSAVTGEDASLPFVRDDLRHIRNHEKAEPVIKTKRCCGSKDKPQEEEGEGEKQ